MTPSARLGCGSVVRLLLATCLVLPLYVAHDQAPAAASDFYTPPADLGTGDPGQVIRSERFRANLLPLAPLPATAWRLMYRSRSATGQPVAVTGTLLVPKKEWTGSGPRPLVGFAPGTQGLADRCAPSKRWRSGTEYESAQVAPLLAKGWAVVVTDYQGLGTPGDHTYVVHRALGRNVLDAIRAARNVPAAGLDPKGPVGIMGYSEGGGAAGAAVELQPTYAPELSLSGAAVGAAPSDYYGLFEHHDGGPFAFLLLYAAIGFDAAYPELDLAADLTPRGRTAAAQMRKTCIENAVVLGLLGDKRSSAYVSVDLTTSRKWRRRLDQNQLGQAAPRTPVLLGISRNDEVMPFQMARDLYDDWCGRGANVHFVTLATPEHLVSAVPWVLNAVPFLSARFRGEALAKAPDCSERPPSGEPAGPAPTELSSGSPDQPPPVENAQPTRSTEPSPRPAAAASASAPPRLASAPSPSPTPTPSRESTSAGAQPANTADASSDAPVDQTTGRYGGWKALGLGVLVTLGLGLLLLGARRSRDGVTPTA